METLTVTLKDKITGILVSKTAKFTVLSIKVASPGDQMNKIGIAI